MEFRRYVKDRLAAILLEAAALGIVLLLMAAFHVSSALIILTMAVLLLFLISAFLWDYFRKRQFYQRLTENLQMLDQKNLLSEIIPTPDFYEGQILHETLYEIGKSMTEQISRAEQSVSDFKEYVEMWVHEAKLPVAALLLKTYRKNDEEMKQIRRQIRKLNASTEQILYFTRSEVAEKDFLIKECSLSKLFGNAASRMREELQESGFELQVSGLNRKVLTDSKWMEFVLLQLLSNSLKYRAEDRERRLEVSAEEHGDRSCLILRDNGIGIPAGDLPRIFEKSFTGENGRRRERSTGMGLYIVKRLCDQLGHSISAESVWGEYTQFVIGFHETDFYRP